MGLTADGVERRAPVTYEQTDSLNVQDREMASVKQELMDAISGNPEPKRDYMSKKDQKKVLDILAKVETAEVVAALGCLAFGKVKAFVGLALAGIATMCAGVATTGTCRIFGKEVYNWYKEDPEPMYTNKLRSREFRGF